MHEYTAQVQWQRRGEAFTDNKYSRAHAWRFDGGAQVLASSSPLVVKPPLSDPAGVDPEEALVASLSSCHMLWFLSIAARNGFVIDDYTDDAAGVLEKQADGATAMTRVTLRPAVLFSGDRQPSAAQMEAMHEEAHRKCFIANSVKTQVSVEPRDR